MDFKKLNKYIENNNVELAKKYIEDLYFEFESRFKIDLLISNIIPEPFEEKNIKFNIEIFDVIGDIFAKEYKCELANILKDVSNVYKTIRENSIKNTKEFRNNKILQLSLDEQLITLITYIDILYDICCEVNSSNVVYNKLLGIESVMENIHDLEMKKSSSLKIQVESYIVLAKELITCLYYNDKKMKKNKSIKNLSDEELYEEFMNLIRLSDERIFLKKSWEVYKYCDFKFTQDYMSILEPNNLYEMKIREIGVFRHENIYIMELKKSLNKERIEESYILDIYDFLLIDKYEYNECSKLAKRMTECTLKILNESIELSKYMDNEIKNIISGYEYLMTLGLMLNKSKKCISENTENQYDKEKVVKLTQIIQHFSSVCSISINDASNIMKLYIFEGKRNTEIFERPLIRMNNEDVLISKVFLIQLNLRRKIDLYIKELDITSKGKYLEDKIKDLLKGVNNLEIEKNNIEFNAFDNKDVEFDFFALMDKERIVIIEIKNIIMPYDYDEVLKCKKIILECVEQVKRRRMVINKDWEEIRKRSSLDLPENPPSNEQVIGCVLTNIFHFSGMKYDGVHIIDEALLVGYLTNNSFLEKINIDDFRNHIEFNDFKNFIIQPQHIKNMLNLLTIGFRECSYKNKCTINFKRKDVIWENNI